MKTTAYLFGALLFLFTPGCQSQLGSSDHSHNTVEATGDHSHDVEVVKTTQFSDKYELYVEFQPLLVNKKRTFAVHLTRLEDYRPVSEGKVTVSLIKDGRGIRHTVDAPSVPGIYNPALLPKEGGIYRLGFLFENDEESIEFQINDIEVFMDETSASGAAGLTEDPDEITFLKDQAWKSEFNTYQVIPKEFHSVINTSGRVKYHPNSEITMNAQSNGIVNLNSIISQSVNKGELLAYISGAGLEDDFTVKLNSRRVSFEKSKADYQRIKPLVESRSVSQKDYLDIESKYLNDSIQYYQLAQNISSNGLKITAPLKGYISEIFVGNGEYVEAGKPILTVSNTNALIIETYVNQSDFNKANSIFDAHFRLPDSNTILTLTELKGKLRSENAFIGSSSSRIPVFFSIENSDRIVPGMFLETFLLYGKKDHAIVVPNTSITEEQGTFYVYVQLGGETFTKREIQIANNDGLHTEVRSGLIPGERIVSQGAYQIKLAAMSGALPIHGHTH